MALVLAVPGGGLGGGSNNSGIAPVDIQYTRVQPCVLIIEKELDILLLNGSEAVMAAYEARRKASHLFALGDAGRPMSASAVRIQQGRERDQLLLTGGGGDGGAGDEFEGEGVDGRERDDMMFEDEEGGRDDEEDWEHSDNESNLLTPPGALSPPKGSRRIPATPRAQKEYRLGKKEVLVHEFGSKVSFRDERTLWQSHVAVKVSQHHHHAQRSIRLSKFTEMRLFPDPTSILPLFIEISYAV